MRDNTVMECDLYTYEAAIARYEKEKHHSWLCRQERLAKIRERQRRERSYYIKQKAMGVFCLIAAVTFLLLGVGEGLFLIPLGIYVMLTKKKVLVDCR